MNTALGSELRHHARVAAPMECCGFLVGEAGDAEGPRLTRLIPSPNLSPTPAGNFEIDPAVHFGLQRRLRDTAEKIVGVYHSHPKTPAVPSDQDLRNAAGDDDWAWVIIGGSDSEDFDIRAYCLRFRQPGVSASGWKEVPIATDRARIMAPNLGR